LHTLVVIKFIYLFVLRRYQLKIAELVSGLVQNQSVAGVYLDQIGSNPPELDCSPGRSHRPGGGSWWVDGNRQMLSRARASAGRGVGLFTEAGEEPFLGEVVGFLARIALDEFPGAGVSPDIRMVPAFQAVYAGYHTAYGRNTTMPCSSIPEFKSKKSTFYATVGQQLVLGIQLGWAGPFFAENNNTAAGFSARGTSLLGIFVDPVLFDFFKRALAVRRAVRPFLLHGGFMRPLPGLGNYTTSAPCLADGCFAVQHAVWSSHSSGTKLLILLVGVVQWSVHVLVELQRYNLVLGRGYEMDQIGPEGQRTVRAVSVPPSTTVEYQLTLAPGEIVVLEVSAKKEAQHV
jgi:hypothetical protein